MNWVIEYTEFDPLKSEDEYIGGYNELSESYSDWDKTLTRFVELTKNDYVMQIIVSACVKGKVCNPFALTYNVTC